MAVTGSGRKVFVAGAKLLASELNGYFMPQALMQFDTTSARDAAFTSGTGEGPHVYTADKDQVWYHNGTTWVMKEGWGTGSPEGLVTSSVGGVWHRTDGGTGSTLYVKESGSGATGWAAHGAATKILTVTNSATQSISNSTVTACAWDTEILDVDNYHDTATNNSRIICPNTFLNRVHLVTFRCYFASNATGERDLTLRTNGTDKAATSIPVSGAGNAILQVTYWWLPTTTGDYIEGTAFQTSGGALNVNGTGSSAEQYHSISIVRL